MREVAIIGAGELGGAIAHRLARLDLVSHVRLVDDTGSMAAGKALDIMQAAPIESFRTRVSGATDLFASASADLVIVADHARGDVWDGDAGLAVVRRLAAFEGRAPILCAGPGHRDVVERGCRELKRDRTSLFGSAPEALASALRALVALEVDGSARDVALTILGVPPHHTVVPWEDVTVGGRPLSRLLAEPGLRHLAALVPALWPPGPHALAAAAVKVVEVMTGRSRQSMSCFVAPDLSTGQRTRASAVPVTIGPGGLARIDTPRLNGHDQVAFDNAVQL